MGFAIEDKIRLTRRGGPDDLLADAERWNKGLKKQTVKVLHPFGWEGRMTVPGEELSVPASDAKSLIFRGKARLA